jgi:hypothetical protein
VKALAGPLLAALGLALTGCAEPVQTRVYPRLSEGVDPIHKVAVARFQAAGALERAVLVEEDEGEVGLPPLPSQASASAGEATLLVSRYMAEALATQGLEVVTSDDLERALQGERSPSGRLVPRQVARVAHAEFGVDAIVLGRVSRFRERQAGVAASDDAASVWFDVVLYSAPGAERLWSGTFNHTQQPFTSNVLSTSRVPGGGTRWLRADELARWGAEETARAMPLGHTLTPSELR